MHKGQAMCCIKPVITKVKLAVAIDKVSDPERTIAQISRDCPRLM
jgi:hypothetical protein